MTDKHAMLFTASRDGSLESVISLVDDGVDINAECDGETPLLLAAEKKHRDIVEYLIRAGADINCASAETKYTLLHYATKYQWIDIVETLLKKGADVNATDSNGLTPFHLAAETGHKDIFTLLMNSGADIDAKGVWGVTPLSLAARHGNKYIVEHLIRGGADVNCPGIRHELSVLHYVAYYGWLDIVKSVLNRGADIDAKVAIYCTPIHLAFMKVTHKDVVEYLINAGADIHLSVPPFKRTLLHYAVGYEWLDVVQSLLKKGADINAKDYSGQAPIHVAAIDQNKDVVAFLINAGANIHLTVSESKTTVLHYAAINKWLDITQSLLEKGADIDAKDYVNCTPLLKAASNDAKDIVECLISAGADVNISGGDDNCTLLHYASRNGWPDIVESLLKKGVNIEKTSDLCQTPLQVALIHNRIEIAKHLINAGAYVNVKWRNVIKSPELVRLLIQNGKYLDPIDYVRFLGCSVLKTCIVKDIELCSQAIINEFNHKDLPQLYELPMVRKILPRIENMRIVKVSNNTQMSQVTQVVMQSVKHEVDSKGFCNVLKASPIVLKMLTVKSLLTYCDNIKRQN